MAITKAQRKAIALEAKKELARRDFFYYCNLVAPDFYKKDRQYLVDMCNEMQDFYNSDDDVLIVNLPPRHGKSRSASLFTQWVFGENPDEKIMTGSYNETLSTTFSKSVRNAITEEKASPDIMVYSDVFPNVRIKRGEAAAKLWALEGQHNSYLATSPTGTATGFGCSLMIIDDLIKNAEEANNEMVLQKHWDWFTNTMLSRLEEQGKIIIIMTRWASEDLAGRAIEHFNEEGKECRLITMKAVQEDGTMLCDEVLSRESFEMKKRAMGEDIVSANYQQIPIDIKGRLYKEFKTYNDIPRDNNSNSLLQGVYLYCDTADEGDDYLCSIVWGVYNNEAYLLDVLFTKESVEDTEQKVAKQCMDYKVNRARIESNNGGKQFARNVKRILEVDHGYNFTKVTWFYQSKNKVARIKTWASYVMEHIYFPNNWRDKWEAFHTSMFKFQSDVKKNAHDDAQDCITGVGETMRQITGGR